MTAELKCVSKFNNDAPLDKDSYSTNYSLFSADTFYVDSSPWCCHPFFGNFSWCL